MKPLSPEQLANKNGIQEHVCDAMNKLTPRPLNEIEMKACVAFAMSTNAAVENMVAKIEKDKEQVGLVFLYRVLTKRIAFYPIEIEERVKATLTLTGICQTPGTVMLYLAFIMGKAAELGIKVVTMDDWAMKMCPMGVFNEKDLHTVWDAQKVMAEPDNLLDHAIPWTTISEKLTKLTKEPA